MALSPTASIDENARSRSPHAGPVDRKRALQSAVSWGAIAAGAAAAASLSLILLILGVGLGLSSASPWSNQGVGAVTFGLATVLWLTLTQLLASAMGGYLAGRLRTKWFDAQADEVYFRDTAHGFLAWAVSTLATAALLTSVIGSIVSGGAQAGATIAGSMTSGAGMALHSPATASPDSGIGGPVAYLVGTLFRRGATGATSEASDRSWARDADEVRRILMNASLTAPLPAEDVNYIAQLVAARTGLSQQAAERRVAETYEQAQARWQATEAAARDATESARQASAYSALWLFISLLIGAFVASLAATFGGRRRDA